MDVLIVDTTRAINGTAAAITDSVLKEFPDPGRLALVMRADQEMEFDPLPAGAETRKLSGLPGDLEAADTVAELVTAYAAESPEAVFTIYSFHHRVLGREGDLAQIDRQLTTRSLRDHVPNRTEQAGSTWPTQLMPLADALVALEQALRRAQVPGMRRAVLKTDLRTHLTMVEPRFDKDRYPLSRTPRLISILLHEAEKSGLILQTGREPQISISLVEDGLPAARPLPVPGAVVVTQPEASALPGQAGGTSVTVAVGVSPAGIPPQSRTSLPAAATVPSDRTRSWHFAAVLRQQKLGPYPEVRHTLYDQIIAIAGESAASSSALTVRALARKAVAATRSAAPDEFPRRNGEGEALPKDRYDWRGLETFAVQILSRTGLALGDDGEPLPGDSSIWTARQAPVRQPLPGNVKVVFDAEMVYEIVCAYRDVTPDDIAHLAGAMLGGRGTQQTDHVEDVMDHLLSEGRVEGEPGTDRLVPAEG